MDLLKSDTERWRVSLFGDRLHIMTERRCRQPASGTRQSWKPTACSVISVREGRFSLEDVFISVVEKAREGKVAMEE